MKNQFLDLFGIWIFIFVFFHVAAVLLIEGVKKPAKKQKFEPLFFVVSRNCDYKPAGPFPRKEANQKADALNAEKKTQKYFITQCPSAYEPGKILF